MTTEEATFEALKYCLVVDEYGTKCYYNHEDQYHRICGPAIVYKNGHKEWWVHGMYHRTDGPAIEFVNGGKKWWVHGRRHRTDGPAVEWTDGAKYWFIDDDELTEEEFLKHPLCTIK